MDYEEEQKQELDALRAIYESDLGFYSEEFPTIKFRIDLSSDVGSGMMGGNDASTSDNESDDSDAEPSKLTPEDEDDFGSDDEEEEGPLKCTLILSFPETYPEVGPDISLRGLTKRIGISRKTDLKSELVEVVDENLGMPMAFTIISALTEKLGELETTLEKERKDEAERKRIEEEEAEFKRFQGTIVTKESFMEWRDKFNEEVGILRKQREAEALRAKKRATGKEQFLKDATLNLSDIQFIQDSAGDSGAVGGPNDNKDDQRNNVQVDESLFEDIDDLDLEDDDED